MVEGKIVVRRVGLTWLAFYLGLGSLFYAILGGTGAVFHWDSAWLYAWVLAWPLMLIVTFFFWCLVFGIAIGVGFWIWFKIYTSPWARARRHARMVADIVRERSKR